MPGYVTMMVVAVVTSSGRSSTAGSSNNSNNKWSCRLQLLLQLLLLLLLLPFTITTSNHSYCMVQASMAAMSLLNTPKFEDPLQPTRRPISSRQRWKPRGAGRGNEFVPATSNYKALVPTFLAHGPSAYTVQLIFSNTLLDGSSLPKVLKIGCLVPEQVYLR